MSVKYYFFPKEFETQLSLAEDSWLQKPDTYITLTGVYKVSETLNESNSLCYNWTILNEKVIIKNGYKDMSNNIYGLIGFCLEADLETISPEYQNQINQIPEILQFTSSQDYLNWLK